MRQAISNCYKAIDNRKNLKKVLIDYDAEKEDIEIQMLYDNKNAEILLLHYLNDGIKSILEIVSDIAYRMAILNPHLLENVIQETDGIVLIDEIDIHLHPAWQRKIISALHEVFQKVQFICTTHSPTALTNVPQENIQISKIFLKRIGTDPENRTVKANAVIISFKQMKKFSATALLSELALQDNTTKAVKANIFTAEFIFDCSLY